MTALGVMYENGRGRLPQDDAGAVRWYRKAAHLGDARGMVNLGVMYVNGRAAAEMDGLRKRKTLNQRAIVDPPTGPTPLSGFF